MDDPWTHSIPLSHLEQWWLQVECACGRSSVIALRRYAVRSGAFHVGE